MAPFDRRQFLLAKGNLQKEMFNGHKRKHGLVFQAIRTPDGLIAHVSKPVPGRRHHLYCLRQSGILQQMGDMWEDVEPPDRYHLIGDPAYLPGLSVMTNFRHSSVLNPQQYQ